MIEFLRNLNLRENIVEIKMLFEYFFGEQTIFFVLFLASVVYIWFAEKDKKIRNIFTIYVLFIFLIIWNPICIKILKKMINFSSLYRVYYMLPMQFTIAIALTKLIDKIKHKILKFVAVLGSCVIIIALGDMVFNKDNTIKVNNLYKLPDETIYVAEAIMNDEVYKEKRAIVPYGMSSRIKQIYSEIYLPYTRIVYNEKDAEGRDCVHDTDYAAEFPPVKALNEGNVEYLKKYVKERNLNFIVITKQTQLSAPLENIDFEKYCETGEHVIYRKIQK